MTLRKHLIEVLSAEPRSVSRLARELRLPRADVEDALRHMLRSARAAGHRIVVLPARCRSCGFIFDEDKLTKPGKRRAAEAGSSSRKSVWTASDTGVHHEVSGDSLLFVCLRAQVMTRCSYRSR